MSSSNCKIIRYISCFLITVCLTSFYGINYKAVYGASNQYISVGLRYSSGLTTATIQSETGLSSGKISEGTYTENYSLSEYDSIKLTLSEGVILVNDAEGNLLMTMTGDSDECLVSASGALDGTINFEGSDYRGGIIPFINSSGQMNIINYLSLDDYVRGVVGSEIGASSGIEALKAQALAAKNFAATTTKHRSQGFDVCTTTNCQVYKGVAGETDSINRAVDAISGKLIYNGDRLIEAYFFSNSGGHTENSEDVWTAEYSYLRGVPDPYAPEYTWSNSLTREKLTSMMTGYNLGDVVDVKVESRNSSGYVSVLKIIGSRASLTLQKDNIRTTLGSSVLKSRNFTVISDSGETSESQLYVYDGKTTSKAFSNINIISSSLKAESPIGALYATDGIIKMPLAQENPRYLNAGSFTFNGKGFGHGVGLSQMSAQQMAKQGMLYDEILKYFYTGIEIK